MRLDRATFLEVVRNTPLVSVDLIVRDSRGRVLLGLRNNAPARHSWFTPGGRICKNERIVDAVGRVALEELGRPARRGRRPASRRLRAPVPRPRRRRRLRDALRGAGFRTSIGTRADQRRR